MLSMQFGNLSSGLITANIKLSPYTPPVVGTRCAHDLADSWQNVDLGCA